MRHLLGLVIAASLGGTAAIAAANLAPLPDLTAYALLRTDGPAPVPVTVDQAADALKDYDVIFLGELHDHAGNHLAEMALFRALYARTPKLALSLEMFERDVQPVLDDYLAGRIGEDALKQRGRAWSNYDEAYRPLVEYAKAHRLPVIAANAPARLVRCIGQEGAQFLATIPPDKRNWAAAELHLDTPAYKAKFMRFLAADGGHGLEENLSGAQKTVEAENSFAAQVARDDTMAESILLERQKHPEEKIVHVTGAFHVEAFLGTVERLKLRAPGLKIAVVVPAEAADPDHPALAPDDAKLGTFAVLLHALPQSYASDAERDAAMEAVRRMIRGRTPAPAKCAL